MKRFWTTTLLTFSLALPLAAQTPRDTTILSPIVVTATRTPEPAGNLGNSVTVLDGASLRRQGIGTVAEALRGVAGIALAQAGSWGAATSLFMRGGESDYVRVLVDGVPLNQSGGAIDLAYISTDNVERIEIVRGPSSVVYGSDAMTGVIQIITRRPLGGVRGNLFAEGGGRSSSLSRGELMAGGPRAGFTVGLEHETTRGIYDFNNHHENSAASARLSLAPDASTDIQVTARHRDGVFHFPTDGQGNPVDSNSFGTSRQSTVGLDAGRRLGSHLELRALLAYADSRDSSDNHPDSPADTVSGSSESGRGVIRRSADLRAILRPNAHWSLTLGGTIEGQHERDHSTFASPGFTSVSTTDTSRTNKAAYLEANGGAGRLSFQTGVRLDDNQRFGDFTTWRAGASVRVSRSTRLRLAAGTAFKEPTFDENYNTAFSTGNPGLKPERSRSLEAGIEQGLGARVTASATGFTQQFHDLIEYSYGGGPPAPDYHNVSSARASGVETEVRVAAMRGLGVSASYTWLTTVAGDSGSDPYAFAKGQTLLRRPAQSGGLSAEWRAMRGHALGARATYIGGRDDVTFSGFTESRVHLPAYTRLDLWGQATIATLGGGATVAITGRVENATNQQFQEIFGYRAPGRRVMIGAEIEMR
ncbi:MAG TPA: TonB-dependent receptor [Gemmatimonadales bacterium]|jgi:vitamin B12 transporter